MNSVRGFGRTLRVLGLSAVILVVAAIVVSGEPAVQASLCQELELLRLFLGSWNGALEEAPDQIWTKRAWTSILDGQAIRDVRTVPEFGFEAEALIFFDRGASTIAYVGITDNGYVTRGEIRLEGEDFVQTGEQTMPDGTVRATRTIRSFRGDGSMVEHFYSCDAGAWQAGHIIIYAPAVAE